MPHHLPDQLATVRAFIVERFAPHLEAIEIGEETSLLADGVLQSIDVVELVLFLEKALHVRIPAHEVTPENFESLAAIQRLVEALQLERS